MRQPDASHIEALSSAFSYIGRSVPSLESHVPLILALLDLALFWLYTSSPDNEGPEPSQLLRLANQIDDLRRAALNAGRVFPTAEESEMAACDFLATFKEHVASENLQPLAGQPAQNLATALENPELYYKVREECASNFEAFTDAGRLSRCFLVFVLHLRPSSRRLPRISTSIKMADHTPALLDCHRSHQMVVTRSDELEPLLYIVPTRDRWWQSRAFGTHDHTHLSVPDIPSPQPSPI